MLPYDIGFSWYLKRLLSSDNNDVGFEYPSPRFGDYLEKGSIGVI